MDAHDHGDGVVQMEKHIYVQCTYGDLKEKKEDIDRSFSEYYV
jgi:hypothetical protein